MVSLTELVVPSLTMSKTSNLVVVPELCSPSEFGPKVSLEGLPESKAVELTVGGRTCSFKLGILLSRMDVFVEETDLAFFRDEALSPLMRYVAESVREACPTPGVANEIGFVVSIYVPEANEASARAWWGKTSEGWRITKGVTRTSLGVPLDKASVRFSLPLAFSPFFCLAVGTEGAGLQRKTESVGVQTDLAGMEAPRQNPLTGVQVAPSQESQAGFSFLQGAPGFGTGQTAPKTQGGFCFPQGVPGFGTGQTAPKTQGGFCFPQNATGFGAAHKAAQGVPGFGQAGVGPQLGTGFPPGTPGFGVAQVGAKPLSGFTQPKTHGVFDFGKPNPPTKAGFDFGAIPNPKYPLGHP